MIVIINTETGQYVRDVTPADKAVWSSGAVSYGVAVGAEVGSERACLVVVTDIGTGTAYTDALGVWDEVNSWLVDRTWYTPANTQVDSAGYIGVMRRRVATLKSAGNTLAAIQLGIKEHLYV